jgi:hypothetical protein
MQPSRSPLSSHDSRALDEIEDGATVLLLVWRNGQRVFLTMIKE